MTFEKNKPLILPCAGAANVGQLSNQAARELVEEGYCRPFCLAAIGAHKKGYVRAAREAQMRIVIDGCSVGCAKGILEQENIVPDLYIIVSDLGIEKAMVPIKAEDVESVKQAVKSRSDMKPSIIVPASDCCLDSEKK